MPNKIEQELSPEELEAFIKELASVKGLTLAKIQEQAKKKGIEISLMSASAFRNKNLAEYTNRIRGASESAKLIAEALAGEDEGSIIDGTALMLSQQLLDLMMAPGQKDSKELLRIALSLSKLRQGDQSERLTLARLREFEAKEQERKLALEELEKKKTALLRKGGISEETLALIEEHAKLLG